MGNIFQSFIRASAFIRKEIFDILRQPRLVFTMILGPFLILFIFGAGYRNQALPLRTLFVAQASSPVAQNIKEYAKLIEPVLIYAGITADPKDALKRLQAGNVDLVIIAPTDAYTAILNNQQAVFTIYYGEIDPVKVAYIQQVGVIFANVSNRQVLLSITQLAQKGSVNLHADLQQAHQNISGLRQAVMSGDASGAQQKQQGLNNNLNSFSEAVGASVAFLGSVQQTAGSNAGNVNSLQNTIKDLEQSNARLNDHSVTSTSQRLSNIERIDNDITDLDNNLAKFQKIDPVIIVNPYRSDVKSIANVQPSESNFFAPAVLVLLLQHLAVTFAALSIVRERSAGALELFRVSPLSTGEVLFGKYVSYMLFGLIIAAILTALLIFGLHLPMLGNWWYFGLVIAAVLFSSLGIGFILSILSQTDSQAVQYSMIVLLASVFFGGFIISLDFLLPAVKIVSWMLPTTYGITLLRDITLKGVSPDWMLLGGLIAIGLALLLISWLLMRRFVSSGH